MFDIGFGELMLVFVIGLVVLGPERLPVAVRTVVGWIKAIRSLASTVQNELTQELKLQELQDSLKKVEEASKNYLLPDLKASMDELREAAESMKKGFQGTHGATEDPAEPHTIHNPLVIDPEAMHDGVTPAEGDRQADAPTMVPSVAAGPATQVPAPAAQPSGSTATPGTPASSLQPTPTAQSSTGSIAAPDMAAYAVQPAGTRAASGGQAPSTAQPAGGATAPATSPAQPVPVQAEPGTAEQAPLPASSTSKLNIDR